MRLASDSRKPRLHDIATRTRLVVFLSTPHSGADMANWIAYIGKLLRATVSVEELQAHHPRLLELNKWYRDHVAELGVETFVYCEKLPTDGVLVVNQTTADPGIAGVDVVPLDEDHVSICKLAGKNQVYRRVQRLLRETLPCADSPVQSSTIPGPGRIKIELCDRLLGDWQKLADYFDITPADRARFLPGREPQAIWEWLESRGRLAELAEALRFIGRQDLGGLVAGHPQ